MDYVLYLILGLSLGVVYATIAIGIVITYQGSGVINFAAAAMATVPLYVSSDLEQGKLTLPLPWIPSIEWGPPPLGVNIAVALVVAAALGALVQVAVSRPLRNAPVLAKVVASVGIMLTLQAAVGLKYGTQTRVRRVLLPTGTLDLGDKQVPLDRIWLAVLVIVLGAGLALWFGRSRTGLAIQAVAENERAAAFARLSPQRLGMITWVVATVFVSLVLIVSGPAIGTLGPTNLTLLVVPGLAAALIARLTSLWYALFGALALGVAQSELQFLSTSKEWWPEWAKQGLTDAVPFLVIVIALVVVGRAVPTRGEDTRVGLPPVLIPRNRPAVVLAIVAATFVAMTLTTGSYRFGLITSLANALIALSLVVLTGMVGQISLAQAGLAGLAGLMVAKIGTTLPFPISMIAAVVIATGVGLLVGLPALRIRGAQLAVVTLAAGVALERFVLNNPQIISPTEDPIPAPSLFGIDLGVREGSNIARLEFGGFVLAVVAIAFILVGNIMRSGSGRKMLAVRSNERAAASIGIAAPRIKLLAFGLSSLLAGVGGTLIGYSRGELSPASFAVFVGLSILAIAYLGGITSRTGAMVAGALGSLGIAFVVMDQNFNLGEYYGLLSGLSLVLTVVLNPLGIAGKVAADLRSLRARWQPAENEARRHVVVAVDRTPRPPPDRTIGETVLETRNITVRYAGLRAVDDLSIEVRAGEIVGLIGPNGAGKTSLIDAITGFTRADGTILLDGVDLTGLAPHARVRAGLARTWQSIELFDDLSAGDNVRVVDDVGRDVMDLVTDAVRPTRPLSTSVTDALELVGLPDIADQRPAELSLGHQKMLGVARSLALRPKALLIDEPAAGLDTAQSLACGEHLRAIAATGVGCLLVDHDMQLVLGVCDRIYVIEFGGVVASGRPEEVRNDPAVVRAYLGSGAEHAPSTVTAGSLA
jgi:ABC-type branched-subunit amino acid transport system ATPase component/branched-subunit amino acid ABC-type transport system permease component